LVGFVGSPPGISENFAHQKGAENRSLFPFTAAMMADLREHGFTGAHVVFCREGDRVMGKRLHPHEVGVPASVIEPDSMPTPGCKCDSCSRRRTPTKTDVNRKQREAGNFGLDARSGWKQPSTFRRDI
jgi:hypothetical protein